MFSRSATTVVGLPLGGRRDLGNLSALGCRVHEMVWLSYVGNTRMFDRKYRVNPIPPLRSDACHFDQSADKRRATITIAMEGVSGMTRVALA